ncbi:CCR4-1 [Symbiodinium natans]|uniref:CCR4-1 protein n=1 Tax=Symbiodinium natans TaxID=878477 RepID=A0A812TFE7_9DINO|nr:CCR4-1 [Symbiodinium natans]
MAHLDRQWRQLEPGPGAHQPGDFDFTVCTFNVLAEGLEPRGCAVTFEQRKQGLLDEIARSQADIVCLQEVDHFDDFFSPELSASGYEGYFVPKTKGPPKESVLGVTEGQAIFVRSDRLRVQKATCWTSIDLKQKKWQRKITPAWRKQTRTRSSVELEEVFGTEKALQEVPQVVLGLFLCPRGMDEMPFLVTNMHLKSRVSDEQLGRAGMSHAEFKHFQLEYFLQAACQAAEELGTGFPVLCCGDMNLNLLGDREAAALVARNGFADSWATLVGDGDRPPVDFILKRDPTDARLVPKAALESPTIESRQPLPNLLYPSDHLLRAVKLCLRA